MKVTLGASTGAKIDVWREDDLFHARRAGEAAEPQTCLGVDLFEVIAELAQLDLEDQTQAAEASASPSVRSAASARYSGTGRDVGRPMRSGRARKALAAGGDLLAVAADKRGG